MELIKDYDMEILYHPGKANVVDDALSRKRDYGMATMLTQQKPLLDELKKLEVEVVTEAVEVRLASLKLQLTLLERIKEAQRRDPESRELLGVAESGQRT